MPEKKPLARGARDQKCDSLFWGIAFGKRVWRDSVFSGYFLRRPGATDGDAGTGVRREKIGGEKEDQLI
jgi:hypothetical protein